MAAISGVRGRSLAGDGRHALFEAEHVLRVVFGLHLAQPLAVGAVVLTLPVRCGGVGHVDVGAVTIGAQRAPEIGGPAQRLRVQRRVVPGRARLAVEQRVTMGERRPPGGACRTAPPKLEQKKLLGALGVLAM